MKEKIGMGIVGAGSIGIRGALEHLSLPDVQEKVHLAAVCDPVPGRAEAAAKKYKVDRYYETYEELLTDPEVDAVTLCSPIGLHYKQGMAAVEAGKHVHFNKTMTTTADEANKLIAKAKEKSIYLVASPGTMAQPHNRRIRRLILEGKLGTVVWAIAGTGSGSGTYHLNNEEIRQGNDILSNIDPGWYFKKPGGGPQYDVTVYCLHNLTGILGPAKQVTALSGQVLPEREFRGKKIVCEMDDSTMLLIDFGQSLFAFVFGTIEDGGLIEGFQPNIYGTEGMVIGAKFGEKNLKLPEDTLPHAIGEHSRMPEAHVFEDIMQLIDLICDGTPSIASTNQARHVIDIIESGYRAAETGKTQKLRTSFKPLPIEAL